LFPGEYSGYRREAEIKALHGKPEKPREYILDIKSFSLRGVFMSVNLYAGNLHTR
jgi:hypothetical protein